MLHRICKECGKPFDTPYSRKMFCDDPHYRVCEGCGKKFLVPPNKLSVVTKVCSEECRRIVIGRASKSRQPTIDKICDACGLPFKALSVTQRFCDREHKLTCQYCGKEFVANLQQLISGTKTCSKACRYALSSQTLSQDPEVTAERVKQHQQVMMERYGVDNPMKLPEVVAKAQATCQEKYGESSFTKTAEFIEKTIATNRRRRGVDWAQQDESVKERSKATCLARYGVDNAGKVGAFIVDKMAHPERLDKLMEFRQNPRAFTTKYFITKPTLEELAVMCGIRASSVGEILQKAECSDVVRYTFSIMEDAVYNFLRASLGEDIEIIQNTHKVIKPYELDVYIPSKHFAIECNPTVTHNSSLAGFGWGDKPKPRGYHKMKTDMCEAAGVHLFHLFGYDWWHHQEACKSMILNQLGCTANKLYARKLAIREVSDPVAVEFLNQNHRQGAAHSKVRLGLYDGEQLVSLMTFSKMRATIGTGKEDLADCWELVRFCSVLNTSVVGGASKLFTHFVRTYAPNRIRSFSDRAHTRGGLYESLGFVKVRVSDPGYTWVHLKTERAFARNNAQKQNICKFLNDDTLDLTKSETELMVSHGFVQVFDSGTITWEWRNT